MRCSEYTARRLTIARVPFARSSHGSVHQPTQGHVWRRVPAERSVWVWVSIPRLTVLPNGHRVALLIVSDFVHERTDQEKPAAVFTA